MLLPSSCIIAYSFLFFPILIASLNARPQAASPNHWIHVNLTDAELAAGGAGADYLRRPSGLVKTSWCRPPHSDLDLLYSTSGGQPLPFPQVISAVGNFREILRKLVRDAGDKAKCDTKSTRARTKGIVVTVLDPLMEQRTWEDLLNILDILLLCCFGERVNAELQGTFFNIKTKSRLASVVIAKVR
ncbi:MAG: hypothetical protein Q9224_002003 [Gallowayella concinna]